MTSNPVLSTPARRASRLPEPLKLPAWWSQRIWQPDDRDEESMVRLHPDRLGDPHLGHDAFDPGRRRERLVDAKQSCMDAARSV